MDGPLRRQHLQPLRLDRGRLRESIATPEDLRADPATAGRPPYGTTVRLVDEEGAEVSPGETGRIFVSNQLTFDGYTGGGNKEYLEGFISSGDIGHFDSEGRLFIDGRDDEMIISGGENVFPAEVEDLITGHELKWSSRGGRGRGRRSSARRSGHMSCCVSPMRSARRGRRQGPRQGQSGFLQGTQGSRLPRCAAAQCHRQGSQTLARVVSFCCR